MQAARVSRRFDHTPLAVAKLSLDGELILVNEALCTLLGAPADALLGRQAAELGHGHAGRTAIAAALEAARTGQLGGEFSQVWRCPSRGDTDIHVRVAWSATFEAGGELPSYITAICVDETERVEAERRAIASEARWRAMLANAADMTWSGAADGTVLSVTAGVVEQLGWRVEDVIGASAFGFVHPDDRPDFRQAWARLVAGQVRQQVLECRLPNIDGTWIWVRETLTDLRDDPHVGAIVGNVVDITARREAQAAQARHEARFRARFERSQLPQNMIDLDGLLVDVNDAFCRMVGLPREQLIGLPVRDLNHPSDLLTGDDAALSSLLSGETDHAQLETTLQALDGRPVPVLVDATLLRDAHGQPERVATFLRDLSSLHDSERRRRQQEDFFLALNQRASDLSMVADRDGRITYVSPAAASMLGYTPTDVVAELGWDFIHPDDLAEAARVQQQVVANGGSGQATMRIRAADGAWRWMDAVITNMLHTVVGGLVSNLRDITAEVQARSALQVSETRYRAIVDTAQEGIWATAPDGSTLYANSRLAAMLGVPLADLYERPGELRRLLLGPLEELDRLAGREATRHDLPYVRPDGQERTFSVSSSALHTADGTFLGSLAMASDSTDARHLERQLLHAALHDALTGLPNRALLHDRLDRALAREDTSTALLFIDLDQFKIVNDSRGHGVGDDVLVAVAQRLTETLRPLDTVARFGGDEFVVVCEDTDEDTAHALAEEVAASLLEPLDVRGGTVHVSASIGVATSQAASGEDLLRYADAAMYAAKAAGRRRVRVFDPELSEQADQRYALSVDLRSALEDDTLAMHYQPIVDLESGAVIGIEALARWEHPVRGDVSPASFVPVAEDMGLGPDLDRWAIRRGMHDLATLRAHGAVLPEAYVSINLSARNLGDRGLESYIEGCLHELSLTPDLVVLEVTETAIMDDTALAVSLLGRLRERGFRIAIDDFGTGYSSLAYLRDLPVTTLKIDRSFVRDIVPDRDALAIVTSIVDLARAVGIDVVAEGVETRTQLELLRTLQCRTAQGWLWSRAQPVAELLRTGALLTTFYVRTQPPATRRTRVDAEAQVGPEHGLNELLELHRTGASLATIAAALNRQGYQSPAGIRWHRNVVARVIADRVGPVAVGR